MFGVGINYFWQGKNVISSLTKTLAVGSLKELSWTKVDSYMQEPDLKDLSNTTHRTR